MPTIAEHLKNVMNLSPSQKNILYLAISETIVTKGKNIGQLKGLLQDDCYDGRTTSSLARRGLLKFHINTIFGSGWAATKTAIEVRALTQKSNRTPNTNSHHFIASRDD